MSEVYPHCSVAVVVLGGTDGDAILAGSGRADGRSEVCIAGVAGGEEDDEIVHLVARLVDADGGGRVGVDVGAPAVRVYPRAVVVVDVEEVVREVIGHLQPRRVSRPDVGEGDLGCVRGAALIGASGARRGRGAEN